MKNVLGMAMTMACLLPAMAQAAPAKLDAQGQMRFVSDAPMERIIGTGEGRGAFQVDFDDLTRSTGRIVVPVRSLKTGNGQRDEHLAGPDWLDAEKYPDIVFAVTAVTVKGQKMVGDVLEAELEVVGDFTMHGVAHSLTAPVTVKRKAEKVKVTTEFKLALADFKVSGRDGAVGSKVGTSIDIKADLKGTLR
jgi:polyisoprenoid-binding protein YceI